MTLYSPCRARLGQPVDSRRARASSADVVSSRPSVKAPHGFRVEMLATLPAGRGGALENRRDLLNLVKLARGNLHNQIAGLVVGERQAAAVEAIEGEREPKPIRDWMRTHRHHQGAMLPICRRSSDSSEASLDLEARDGKAP